MNACTTCHHEYDGTPCDCRDLSGMEPDYEFRRTHPDPHIEMGRTLRDAEAMFVAGPAWRARHATPLPNADDLGRRLFQVHGNLDAVEAYLSQVRRAASVDAATDRAQAARRAGL